MKSFLYRTSALDIERRCFRKILDSVTFILLSYCVAWTILRPSLFPWFVSMEGICFMIEKVCITVMLVIGLIKIYLAFDSQKNESILALCVVIILSYYKFVLGSDSLDIFVPVIALFDTDIDDILKCYISAAEVTFFIVVLSSIVGIIPNLREVSNSERFVNYRNGCGFYNVDFPPAFFLFISLAVGSIYRKSKHAILVIVLLIVATLCSFYFTGGLSATIAFLTGSMIILLHYFISKVFPENNIMLIVKRIFYFVMIIFPILAVLIDFAGMFFMKYMHNSYLISVFYRYLYTYQDFKMLGLKFPAVYETDVVLLETNYNFLFGLMGNWDSRLTIPHQSNMLILLKDGFVVLLIYVFLQVRTAYKLSQKKQFMLLVFFNTAILFGCFESLPYRYSACSLFLWLFFAKVDR